MRVRVLHIATRHRLGGAERNLLHSISCELGRGFDVHVAVGPDGLQDDFPTEVQLHLVPDLVREVSPIADRRAVRALRALIRDQKFDVVHTHQSKGGALGRLAVERSVPLVIHTVHMASFGQAYGRVQSALFVRVERRLARITDRFVFVGTDLRRRYLVAGAAHPDRSIVIRSPIANLASLIELRDLGPELRDHARAAAGVPLGHQMILMVGALDQRKRQDLAIKSLAPLLARGKTHLLIAGDGPERRPLERLCASLRIEGAVRFAGFVSDVRRVYAAADLLVHTSALEGMAQSIVQALAAGIPVVATEADGVRELAVSPGAVSVLPLDGGGLLHAVDARLADPDVFPVSRDLIEQWSPASVNAQLRGFYDSLEAHTRRGSPRPSAVLRALTTPAATGPPERQAVG